MQMSAIESTVIVTLSTSQPLVVSPSDGNYGNDSWTRMKPTMAIFLTYAFVVPVFSCFGLCANFINAIVFMRPKMTPSAFTYLAALSLLDCASCILITLTALSRSIFYDSVEWLIYDFQWQTPLFGITTGAANLVLACVSLDRLVYLWHGIPSVKGTPRFCRRKMAKRMIAAAILLSVVINLPYFFVFVVNDDCTFHTTQFYSSRHYKIHNWFSFIFLTVLPAIFLLVGNGAIIIAFHRWTKQSKKCTQSTNGTAKLTTKRLHHQMKLTITILIVITLYLIGELPAHLFSRKSALNLVFGGDISRVDMELMEQLEVIFITLNAIQLSMNILIYALINPSFMPEFFLCLRGASDKVFKIFGCTALAHCCRCGCGKKQNNPNEQEQIQPQSHSDGWDAAESQRTEDLCEGTVQVCSTKTENVQKHDNDNTTNEKRRSSLGDFVYLNPALELENNVSANDTTQRRHSITTLNCEANKTNK